MHQSFYPLVFDIVNYRVRMNWLREADVWEDQFQKNESLDFSQSGSAAVGRATDWMFDADIFVESKGGIE